MSLKQMVTTPYHPVCNGLVEKLSGTSETMQKYVCRETETLGPMERTVVVRLIAYRPM